LPPSKSQGSSPSHPPRFRPLTRQCDALRPACNPCLTARLLCAYDLPAGLTPREAVKRNLAHLAVANENLRAVIEYMRACSEDECRAILKRIREAASADEAVQELVDASLLLRDSAAAAGWGSESGSPAAERRAGGTPSGPGEPPSSPDVQR
jgi:hypothetical protein